VSGTTGACGVSGAATNVLYHAIETELTGTGSVVVATYTPGSGANVLVSSYFRVVTGATAVTITITWTDVTGAQTITILNAATMSIGSYALAPVLIDSAASSAVAVNFTAGTANQVYASASIIAG